MTTNPTSLAKLFITLPNGSTQEKELQAVEFRIGRGPQNDLVLDDSFASTQHAAFRLEAGAWVIHDFGSANGTRLNNQRISGSHPIQTGDIVQIGHTKFVFTLGQGAPVVPAAPATGYMPVGGPPAMTPGGTAMMGQPAPSGPGLHVTTGAGKEFEVHLTGTSIKIGRAPQNDIVLDDGFTSTYHAEIRPANGGTWQVTDMGSSNGTKVNDQRIAGSRPLLSGDVIQVGRARIVFTAPPAAPAPRPGTAAVPSFAPPLMPPPGFGAPPHGAPLYPAPAPEPTGSAKVPLLVVVMPT
ncbi:MAG: FHA domain-containing protein, partial [Acidobacteria bacterium]|nr:FHA domain-containing protein [Acidobacteriota bacterium]